MAPAGPPLLRLCLQRNNNDIKLNTFFFSIKKKGSPMLIIGPSHLNLDIYGVGVHLDSNGTYMDSNPVTISDSQGDDLELL
jgi:hypothetical protein